MEEQLSLIANSYDRAIDLGRNGIDLYENLPKHITCDPDYPLWKAQVERGEGGSERSEIRDYLAPAHHMNFVDLGCCLNLMFKGYDRWPSLYHGVDISAKTIALLNTFAAQNKLSLGSLHCAGIHETPFGESYFDIGACIGVLEYFEKEYVESALKEAHRIIKPNGKLVLDIPNIQSAAGHVMMLIEEHIGRPDRFNMSPEEFEALVSSYFAIEKTDKTPGNAEAMILYCLRCKK